MTRALAAGRERFAMPKKGNDMPKKSELELLTEAMREARELLADVRGVQKDLRRDVTEAKQLLSVSIEARLEKKLQDALEDADQAMVAAIRTSGERVVVFFEELRDMLLEENTSIGELAHDWHMLKTRIMREPSFLEMVQETEPKVLTALAISAMQEAGIPVPKGYESALWMETITKAMNGKGH